MKLQFEGKKKLRDLIYEGFLQVAREIPDAWPILADEERQRIEKNADTLARDIEAKVSDGMEDWFTEAIAKGHASWIGKEKDSSGITLSKTTLELKLIGSRENAPPEIFNHSGGFLVILTNRAMSLREFQSQDELDLGAATDDGTQSNEDSDTVGDDEFDADANLDSDIMDLDIALEGFGVPEEERKSIIRSRDALRELFDKRTPHEVAKCYSVHGQLTEPPKDTDQDAA